MKTKIENLSFKYTWRNYQQRFLNGFEDHIKDNHLHVIAPPGSGKTILGIEMLIRIGKPTLILAPTLTIRNQWKSRMKTFFDKEASFNNFSLDIKHPKQITFSTYQSLFSLHKSFKNNHDQCLLDYIIFNKIETIVLDEAHHLKNGWWKSLFAIKKIESLNIIALTATPPYDSSTIEINRYFDLCGPIDDEIVVPDLINNGDLCPHQDYIYFSKPNKEEIKYIIDYRTQILEFTNLLLQNQGFVSFLKNLDIYKNTQNSLELIYQNPSFFSSILIFLKATGQEIDKSKLEILGFENQNVEFPSFTYEWSEVLLQNILISQREIYKSDEDLLTPITKDLKQIGVLENKKINFIGDKSLYKNLANSPSKFESIEAIIKATVDNLKAKTRAVILTDFIRKEYLSFSGEDTKLLRKIGVVSIFQFLLAKSSLDNHMAVLTGTLVILHENVIDRFKSILKLESISILKIESSSSHYSVSVGTSIRNRVVSAITQLFEQGDIKILIGTKALLGEGWDAPSINTLILASYVGSFVSSNQMRGRAIRIDPKDSDKVGSIWHLVCLDPTVEDGGRDLRVLNQRFRAFTGVSLKGDSYIENGLSRLMLPEIWAKGTDIDKFNKEMLCIAIDTLDLKNRWEIAIQKGNVLVHELRLPYSGSKSYKETKRFHSVNVAKYLFFEIVIGISFFLPEVFIKNLDIFLSKGGLVFFYIILGALFFGFAPAAYKALKIYFLFGNQFARSLKIAKALFGYLKSQKLFTTASRDLKVFSNQRKNGTYSIYLLGANQHDGNLFVKLLEELIAPIENPKYLILVNSRIKRFFGYKDYYAIPTLIGRKKEDAIKFSKHWKKYIGGSKIIYTRTISGRKLLLKARFNHIRYQFKDKPEKTAAWK